MKNHCTAKFMRAAALLAAIIYGGNILVQAQSCSATWIANAGNGWWSTAGNWSPRKVPGPTSDVCIPTLTTANGAGLDGSSSSISVHSIQVAEGGWVAPVRIGKGLDCDLAYQPGIHHSVRDHGVGSVDRHPIWGRDGRV
jgi:hypothetical protein